jgi:hypothetical protein
VSAASYRAAARRYRQALGLLGPFRGPCGLCGGPDARHRVGDALAEQLGAGCVPEDVAVDFVSAAGPEAEVLVLRVAVAALAVDLDRARSRLSRDAAAALDLQVWAEAEA